MLKIYSYPAESAAGRGKRIFLKILPAVLILLISMIPLFYFMMQDSEQNRDAVRKVTSKETEAALLSVCGVFLLSIIYMVIVGVRESSRNRRCFTSWVHYRGRLYIVSAAFTAPHSGSSNRAVSRAIKSQENNLRFLNDEYSLRQILDSGEIPPFISIYCVERIPEIRKTERSIKLRLENGRAVTILRSIRDYQELGDILKGLVH